MGRRGILQIRARTAQRLANGGNRLVLADDDAGHLSFNGQQPLGFALFHALERNAGPLGNDVQNIFFVHRDAFFLAVGAPGGQHGVQFFLGLLFLVAHGGGAFKILVLDGAFLAALDVFDLRLNVFDLRRDGSWCRCARANRLHP